MFKKYSVIVSRYKALVSLFFGLLFKSGKEGRRILFKDVFGALFSKNNSNVNFLLWGIDNYRPRLKASLWSPSSRITSSIKFLHGPEFFLNTPSNSRYHKPKVAFLRHGALGDVLLAEPVISEFARQRPDVEVIVATNFPIIFKNHPYIFETINVEDLKRYNHFSAIFNLDELPENQKEKHIVRAYADFIIGNDLFDLQPHLFYSDTEIQAVTKFIESIGRPFCVVHNRIDKAQPFRNVEITEWVKFLNEIHRRHPEIVFLQIGQMPNDVAIKGEDFLDLLDHFSIHEVAILISQAKLFIGTDAGPLHIAGTTNTPILSFFTYVPSHSRNPLRNNGDFLGVDSYIECAGCWTQFTRPHGWYCQRGDFACSKSFDFEKALPFIDEKLSLKL
jgi:ADP-heptose:LPS heptosyltransferase